MSLSKPQKLYPGDEVWYKGKMWMIADHIGTHDDHQYLLWWVVDNDVKREHPDWIMENQLAKV